jgi:hypothetical protein
MAESVLYRKLKELESLSQAGLPFGGSPSWNRLEKIFEAVTDGESAFRSFLLNESCFDRFIAIEIVKKSAKTILELSKWTSTNQFLYFPSNVRIDGHLANSGIVVVEGNLSINGDYFNSTGSFTSLVVGGKIQAQNMITSGEVICADRICLQGLGYFHYNDYCTISPTIDCKILVEDDRQNFFNEVHANLKLNRGFNDEEVERLLGIKELPGDSEADDLLLEYLYQKAKTDYQILKESD